MIGGNAGLSCQGRSLCLVSATSRRGRMAELPWNSSPPYMYEKPWAEVESQGGRA